MGRYLVSSWYALVHSGNLSGDFTAFFFYVERCSGNENTFKTCHTLVHGWNSMWKIQLLTISHFSLLNELVLTIYLVTVFNQ